MRIKSLFVSLISLSLAPTALADCNVFQSRLASAKDSIPFSDLMPKTAQTVRDRNFYAGDKLLTPFDMCRIRDDVYGNKITTKYECRLTESEPATSDSLTGFRQEHTEASHKKFLQEMGPKFAEVESCILALKDTQGIAYAHGSLASGSISALFNNETPYDGADDVNIDMRVSNVGFRPELPKISVTLEIRTGQRQMSGKN